MAGGALRNARAHCGSNIIAEATCHACPAGPAGSGSYPNRSLGGQMRLNVPHAARVRDSPRRKCPSPNRHLKARGLRLFRFLKGLAIAASAVLSAALWYDVDNLVAIVSQLISLPASSPVNPSTAALRLAMFSTQLRIRCNDIVVQSLRIGENQRAAIQDLGGTRRLPCAGSMEPSGCILNGTPGSKMDISFEARELGEVLCG
jgi:hypothetical protein